MGKWVKKKKKKEEEFDQFHRLPDHVVVYIFDKVSDVKWLCRCLVVSKRFSSLIPLVQTLSFKTNAGWEYLSIPCYELETTLVNGSLGATSKLLITCWLFKTHAYLLMPSFFPSLLINASFLLEFLAKATRVRSLNLELVSDFGTHTDSVFKWGAKFTSELDSLTFVYALSLEKIVKKSEEKEEIENEITQEELNCRVNLAINCLKEAVLRLGILYHILAKNPKLQSITITDSNKKGVELSLGGEKLLGCRSSFSANNLASMVKSIKSCTREITRVGPVGYVPVLRLPRSSYVMKRVTVVHFNLYGGGDDSDAETAMLDAFAEEQDVFLEAVVQILENHKGVSRQCSRAKN